MNCSSGIRIPEVPTIIVLSQFNAESCWLENHYCNKLFYLASAWLLDNTVSHLGSLACRMCFSVLLFIWYAIISQKLIASSHQCATLIEKPSKVRKFCYGCSLKVAHVWTPILRSDQFCPVSGDVIECFEEIQYPFFTLHALSSWKTMLLCSHKNYSFKQNY